MNRSAPIQHATRPGFFGRLTAWLAGTGGHEIERREPTFMSARVDRHCEAARIEPIRTSRARQAAAGASVRLDPALAVLPAAEHATRLLAWLREMHPVGGVIEAATVMAIYGEMCVEQQLQPLHWTAVGRKLRPMTGPKGYVSRGRGRICVYRIPPRAGGDRGDVAPIAVARRLAA